MVKKLILTALIAISSIFIFSGCVQLVPPIPDISVPMPSLPAGPVLPGSPVVPTP